MSQKLATVQKIHSIRPHSNPEVNKIECAFIKGWPVVIPKGIYSEGELVAFIEIDVIVPETPLFEFMRRQKFRTWNARFKGEVSSGLVMKLSDFNLQTSGNPHFQVNEGDDISEQIGVKKFERPIDLQVGGDAIGGFPTHLASITDELNLLSYPEALLELEGKEIIITSKRDGSSTSFFWNNGEFQACSRRQSLKEGSGFPWLIEKKYQIKEKLSKLGGNWGFSGEATGPKLNGNSLELKDIEFHVFRVKNLDENRHLGRDEYSKIAEVLGLPIVDEIYRGKFNSKIHTLEWFRTLADRQVWSTNNKPAEGIVISSLIPFYSESLGKNWSAKVINSNYK